MPVMLIRIHGIIIMIYMIFWGYHIRNNETKKNWFWHFCRVQKLWHTANVSIFAVCKNHGTWQRFELCRVPHLQGTWQIFGHVTQPGWLLYFAVGREWHTANPLPCARYIAHGKSRLCRCLVAVCTLPCAAHSKGFAVGFWGFTVCPWHTAKGWSPVVNETSS